MRSASLAYILCRPVAVWIGGLPARILGSTLPFCHAQLKHMFLPKIGRSPSHLLLLLFLVD